MIPERQLPADQRNFIVWLDPGFTTGLAYYDMASGTFFSWQYEREDLARRFTDYLFPMVGERMAVGYELFITTSGGAKTSTPEHALKTIALVKHLTDGEEIPLLRPQPSSARKLATPVMLRRLGWYKPGKPHANDAGQHLLAYMIKKRPMPPAIRKTLFPGYEQSVTIAP